MGIVFLLVGGEGEKGFVAAGKGMGEHEGGGEGVILLAPATGTAAKDVNLTLSEVAVIFFLYL
jgi:hypothetical protein